MSEASEPCGAVRMLTYGEVAGQLGISIRQVYNLVQAGKLAAHKYGGQRNSPVRISQADVYAYVEATRAPNVSTDDTSRGDTRTEGDQ